MAAPMCTDCRKPFQRVGGGRVEVCSCPLKRGPNGMAIIPSGAKDLVLVARPLPPDYDPFAEYAAFIRDDPAAPPLESKGKQ